MRLPLDPFYRKVLRAYGLAPTQFLPKKLPKKKDKREEAGWYYFSPWRSHKPFVLDGLSSIKHWKEGWLWDDGLDILRAIYLQSFRERRFDSLLKAPRHLVELGQMAKKVDFKQGKRPTPPLVKVMVTKVRELRPGSSEDSHQMR
ncbi:hypothetical protein Adt_18210 [Abeliophyllum distichum]|uniref:Uncharacterized protein n=1 Tax=Abeliophyllum distichum TaxID=126358 RepID=A0ABD1TIQ7_9LAMI